MRRRIARRKCLRPRGSGRTSSPTTTASRAPTRARTRAAPRSARTPATAASPSLGSDEEPWSRQVEILHAVRDYADVDVVSGHNTGKSFISARVALWYLFTGRDRVVLTTAPTDKQVKEI